MQMNRTYIALLRGINVGGHNKIKMAELRETLEKRGLEKVKTYIQSGNILFQSEKNEGALIQLIGQGITEDFGFSVAVVIRTKDEWARLISNCPFPDELIKEAEAAGPGESLYAAFLSNPPSDSDRIGLEDYMNDQERFMIAGRDVYLLFFNSIRNSKLAGQLQKLDPTMTTRNWKTINKINELAENYLI